MWKPLIRSTVVGGVTVFIWYVISWMFFYFPVVDFKKFENPTEVTSTIFRGAPEDGIYIQSGGNAPEKGRPPFILANVAREYPLKNMAQQIIVAFFTQVFAAFFVSLLLLQTKASYKYWPRVGFVTVAGIFAAILSYMPLFIWMRYPIVWMGTAMINMVIAWFIAGLLMGHLSKR